MVELKSMTLQLVCGVLCVGVIGTTQMLRWLVDNWGWIQGAQVCFLSV